MRLGIKLEQVPLSALDFRYLCSIMAGVYIHIPFCRRKCIYCDFYSVALSDGILSDYVLALRNEFDCRKAELGGEAVETVYVGGGTPSLMPVGLLSEVVAHVCDVKTVKEVTVEVNPDDVTAELVEELAAAGFNRVSMGVQSFVDGELRFLNRRHDAAGAENAIALLRNGGMENISIDLIYGIPGQTLDSWERSVEKALSLNVPHVSAYSLTYEEGTRLAQMRERMMVKECNEELCVAMFDLLVDRLKRAGFEHYEISNFAKPGCYSRHNSAYWNFTPYLGIGPSAHSFDGKTRRYNPPDIRGYMKSLLAGSPVCETEQESDDELYNEWVMTRLRTMWGVDLKVLETRFGTARACHAQRVLARYEASGDVAVREGVACLTKRGVMVSDAVFRDLFIV